MKPWPANPSIYEIGTWTWLADLRKQHQSWIDLTSVPASEWDRLAGLGFDAVWLMGVWERSPMSRDIAAANPTLDAEFHRTLSDFRPEDNTGSPYSVHRYVAAPELGGPAGLARARADLARRGVRLILDFVPNHVAPDHPWVHEHPEYFVQLPPGSDTNANGWIERDGIRFACGRDPNYPPWPDVLQLNTFNPALRKEVRATLLDIATQCDGVRCDMAMLPMNAVFTRTWGGRVGPAPVDEYWTTLIPAVKARHPGFLFMAEAYWDLEWDLQQQGFDYCYDKRLYDRLAGHDAAGVRSHLAADLAYQSRLVRFIENHDEPRAAAAFTTSERVAAIVGATLPGARLFHDGQFEGRRVHVPVFLARRPEEAADQGLHAFYEQLAHIISTPALHSGQWAMCHVGGWADNTTSDQLVAWCWAAGDDRWLLIVNLGAQQAQGRVAVPWSDAAGGSWHLHDDLHGDTYERSGDELSGPGIYVDLAAGDAHIFACNR